MTIETLIDKQDNFEVIRDEIAAILKLETISQQKKASAADKDPVDWAFRVFTERANPWEQYREGEGYDPTPIINVWFDNSGFDEKASNALERQDTTSVYNIDCMAPGITKDNPAGGHFPGDQAAVFAAQRTVRLCRNIIMSAHYRYLNLQGLVSLRWPQGINSFQPQLDENSAVHVAATRIALRVRYNEFAPQYVPVELEYLSAKIIRAEDGEILLQTDFEYPL